MRIRIKDIREDKDLTQKAIAKLLNCSQQTYSRYESGEITIDISRIVTLAEFYGTSTDYLLGLTDEQKPYSRRKEYKNK